MEIKEKLGIKIPCSLKTLTPVHVGSGVKLSKGIDFIATPSSVTIITEAELMEHLENNPEEIELFAKGEYKLNALSKMPSGKKYYINNEKVFDIAQFIRNGLGKPYIPGSSIKGAIRTVILKNRFKSLSAIRQNSLFEGIISAQNVGKEWAAEALIKEIFGLDSNHNLMRALQVFDAQFSEVSLEKVLILSLANLDSTSYAWKKMGQDVQNQTDPSRATSIFIEALPADAEGNFSLSLNSFLFNNEEAKRLLKFSEPALESINELVKSINNYSLEKLNKEKAFFVNLTSPTKLDSIIANIDFLIDNLTKLQKDEFIIRLSWGSGWEGMTGNFLSREWLDKFRKKFGRGMGKPNFSVFPKTRRIIFEGNEPKYLTGWVKVKLNDSITNSGFAKKQKETDALIDDSDWAAKLGTKFKVNKKKKN